MWIIIVCFIIVVVVMVNNDSRKKEEAKKIQEQELEAKRAERREIEKKENERKRKEKEELLKLREEKYGALSAQYIYYKNHNYDFYVYEQTKVVFIGNKEYKFSDFLSCNIEEILVKKGVTTETTTPDKGQMAMYETLYGQGPKYNVKTNTVRETTPDIYKYNVIIGINDFQNSMITLSFGSSSDANSLKCLLDVVINKSKEQ